MGHESENSLVGAWIRDVRRAWRRLTGGDATPDPARSTLIGISGGADSMALAIALGTLDAPRVVLATVQHDLRPAELVHDDRAAVLRLGRLLGARVVTEHVSISGGNAEHEARDARYRALSRLARREGCGWLATAHHGGDQLETVLLAMGRGASPAALLGIHESRPAIEDGVTVIRPMLRTEPELPAQVCRAFGVRPRVDATNADPARARGSLRCEAIPALVQSLRSLPGGGLMSNVHASIDRLRDRIERDSERGQDPSRDRSSSSSESRPDASSTE